MPDAYITHTASILPGPPIPNEEIERYLGVLPGIAHRLRDKVLNNNGITSRHYALKPGGEPTHSLAGLHADAIRALLQRANRAVEEVDLLSLGTSVPEVIAPSHGVLVHGELGGRPCEVHTTAAICCASISALKYAALAVQAEDAKLAVAGAADRPSSHLRASHYSSEITRRSIDEDDPHVSFHAAFLRWMLSDGAGAVLLSNHPREDGLSLKIEWIEGFSFAHTLPTCMYMGGTRTPSGGLRGWCDEDSIDTAIARGVFNLQQDVGLLKKNIVDITVHKMLAAVRKKRHFTPEMVDWILPHYSSELFRRPSIEGWWEAGFTNPEERFWSNLSTRGNTGSASIYIMLDEFLATGKLRPGQGVLLAVPESARFGVGYALLRAVEP